MEVDQRSEMLLRSLAWHVVLRYLDLRWYQSAVLLSTRLLLWTKNCSVHTRVTRWEKLENSCGINFLQICKTAKLDDLDKIDSFIMSVQSMEPPFEVGCAGVKNETNKIKLYLHNTFHNCRVGLDFMHRSLTGTIHYWLDKIESGTGGDGASLKLTNLKLLLKRSSSVCRSCTQWTIVYESSVIDSNRHWQYGFPCGWVFV